MMDFSERREPIEPKEEDKIMDETAYFNLCIGYALSTGWVKPEQKEILIGQYLKPIYQKYTQVLEEVGKEIALESDGEMKLKMIIKKLNHLLDRTKRIGSTDHNNITKSIYEYCDRFCQGDDHLEYATTALSDFISDLLYSKS